VDPTGESTGAALKLDFDRRLRLRFRGSVVSCDVALSAYREWHDVVGLRRGPVTCSGTYEAGRTAGMRSSDCCLSRCSQSGYEDVNDAERLCHNPATRGIVGDRAGHDATAWASEMGGFERQWCGEPRPACQSVRTVDRARAAAWAAQAHHMRRPSLTGLDRFRPVPRDLDLAEQRETEALGVEQWTLEQRFLRFDF